VRPKPAGRSALKGPNAPEAGRTRGVSRRTRVLIGAGRANPSPSLLRPPTRSVAVRRWPTGRVSIAPYAGQGHLTRRRTLVAGARYHPRNDLELSGTWQNADRTSLWRSPKNTPGYFSKPDGSWSRRNVSWRAWVPPKVRFLNGNGSERSFPDHPHGCFGVVDFLVAMTQYLTPVSGPTCLWMGHRGSTPEHEATATLCEVENQRVSAICRIRCCGVSWKWTCISAGMWSWFPA